MTDKTLNGYEIIKKLGTGAQGTVYKAKKDDKIIALKVIDIDPQDRDKIENATNEIEFLTKLSKPGCNPFVVCYYGSSYDKEKGKFLVEMEYIEGQEMFDFVVDMSGKDLDKLYRLLVAIAKDAAEGLRYIHSKGIIHNDIKLENIMIEKDTNIPKIIDFGLACNMKSTFVKILKYCISYNGTPYYIPPEFISEGGKRYPASDMWSLGVVLYAGAKGEYPYELSEKEKTGKVKEDATKLFEMIDRDDPPKLNTSNITLNTIVNKLLVKNHNQRLTPGGVLGVIEKSKTTKFTVTRNIPLKEEKETRVSSRAFTGFLLM